jgi:hypothetical protein
MLMGMVDSCEPVESLVVHFRADAPILEYGVIEVDASLVDFFDGRYAWVNSTPGFTMFYDWLRNSADVVIGCRFYPNQGCHGDLLLDTLTSFPYCRMSKPGLEVEVFFGEERIYETETSCDQEFGYTSLWRSKDGRHLAGSFDMYWLQRADFEHLAILSLPLNRG